MIELIVAIVLIVLTLVFLKIKNKKSNAKPDNVVTVTPDKPIKQESVSVEKVAIKPVTVAVPSTKASEPVNKNLPQDFTLRRHYLTHLRTIIVSINPQRPTDSALSRHYDTEITAQLEQSLSGQQAIQELLACYENHKKNLALSVVETHQSVLTSPVVEEIQVIIESSAKPETSHESVVELLTERKASKIPEDSQLRRHYISHLYAQVSANLPPRPTDSTLRRHHDSLLENEVKSRLAAHG
jgi:hypothetical protein